MKNNPYKVSERLYSGEESDGKSDDQSVLDKLESYVGLNAGLIDNCIQIVAILICCPLFAAAGGLISSTVGAPSPGLYTFLGCLSGLLFAFITTSYYIEFRKGRC